MRPFLVLVVLFLLAAPGCRNLPSIDKGVCGNAVVEPSAGEDCDRFAAAGERCRPPGEAEACRYDCALRPDGTRPTCPGGMGCAEDGICRWPSGGFDHKAVSVPAVPYDLGTADFDGDGRADLLVTEGTRATVHYFGDAAAPSGTLSIPRNWTPGVSSPLPALGELSDDGLPDAVVPFGSGIVAALGAADRSLVSTSYPALAAPANADQIYLINMDVLPDPGDESLLLAHTTGGPLGGIVLTARTGVTLLTPSLFAPSDLAGDIATGDLDEDPVASPCEEMLMPIKELDRLIEFSPCKLGSNNQVVLNTGGSFTPVLLPAGDAVLGPLTLLDLDHDGHLDAAFGAHDGSKDYIDVAYGVGDGTFNSTSPVPASNGDGKAARAAEIASAPLAIGDLDGDGAPDYVGAKGVYLHESAGFETVADSDSEGWSEALIVDLNDNGVPDVIAANDQQPGAVFLNGSGDGRVSRFNVASAAPLSHFTVGDYDGDLLEDVAAVETEAGGGVLSVMFGRSHGAPEPAERQALLGHALQIASARSYGLGSSYAIDSISAVLKAHDGTIEFSGFSGRGDRHLRSPFVVTTTEGKSANVTVRAYYPRSVVAGDFDGDGHGDLAEVTVTYPSPATEHRLWLCPMSGKAEIALSDPRSGGPLPTGVDWEESEMASGDLDGDGTDEVVLLAPLPGSGSRGYVARSHDTGDGQAFELSKPTQLDWRFSEPRLQTTPGDSGGGRALVADVDADGHADVVALAPTADKKTGALVVFHGDGKPALGAPQVVPATPDGPAIAFTTIQTDRDPALELALLAGDNVYIADLGNDGRYQVRATPAVELSATKAGLGGAGLLAAGDYDGDGVGDIAVGNASSVAVFRGVPGIR